MIRRTISEDEFERSVHCNCHYEGFVVDVGYVYWNRILIKSQVPSYPYNSPLNIKNNIYYVNDDEFTPTVIPEEVFIDDLSITPESISQVVLKDGPKDTVILSLFNGQEYTLDKSSSRIDISIDDKYDPTSGKQIKVVSINAVDQINGRTINYTCSLKEAISNLTGRDYMSYIAGAAQHNLGHYLEKYYRLRSVSTTGGQVISPDLTPRRFGLPWEKMNRTFKGLKVGGAGLTTFGILLSGRQLQRGKISKQKFYGDAAFALIGTVGGIPGMVTSIVYFSTVSPYIDVYFNSKEFSTDSLIKP